MVTTASDDNALSEVQFRLPIYRLQWFFHMLVGVMGAGRIRTKVEYPFQVIKRQFDFTKPGYRGIKKNGLQIKMQLQG